MKLLHLTKLTLSIFAGALLSSGLAANNPFAGNWELTMPGGPAGWLGVKDENGGTKASMMWGFGSVEPLTSAKLQGNSLVMTKDRVVQKKNAEGKNVKETVTETITAVVEGDKIHLTSVKPKGNGQGMQESKYSGRRTPPMPAAPDLQKVRYGEPISLFNGKDLSGWRLLNPGGLNGWSARDGVLVNTAVQEEGKPHKNYGNLRTDAEFSDFNLKLEARVPKSGNSGIYLRGIYEVQVADSYGQGPESHRNGAIYSRITPTSNPSKAPGEWQTYDISLVDRHVTVVLNEVKIIDNQPVEGCTGGALWSDVSRPGPIYLQGDHTSVEYRNVVLRPVVR